MSNTHAFVVKNGLEVGTSITATGQLTTAGQTFPASDGSTGQYLTTNGSGALSWGTVTTSFNITDGTTTDSVGGGETVTFTGGTNITLAVTDNTVTINNDVIDSGDITESGNLFFTDTRAVDAVEGHAHLTIDGGTLYVDTSNNYVGIGDTSPQQKLDVAGNIGINGTEVINASGTIVGAVADSAMTIGGSLAGVLSNTKMQYANSYSGTPIQGSFFFDSLNAKLKVYTGSAFVDAVPASSGGGGGSTDANSTFRDYSFTLTGTVSSITGVDDHELTAGAFVIGHKYTITSAGNTSFTAIGAADNNVNTVFVATGAGSGTGTAKQTLFYNTANNTSVAVYVNGVKQVYGSGRDFVATTGTSVNFTYNLGAGDTVDVQVFELLTNSAYYVKSEVYTKAETNTQVSTALPLAGGTMTGDTLHGDNVKAKFGTGGDLEIYHDGSNSYIKEAGTGDLIVLGNNVQLRNTAFEYYLTCITDAGVTAYYNNVAKLATTATGVDISGTVTSDGLVTTGSESSNQSRVTVAPNDNQNRTLLITEQKIEATAPSGYTNVQQGIDFAPASGYMKLNVGNSERMRIDSSGNVGIGTSSVDSLLHLQKSDATAYSATATDGQVGVGPTLYLENPANSNATVGGQIVFGMRSTESQARIGATGGAYPVLTFGTGDAERMRIDSSGNVVIGGTSAGSLSGVNAGLTIRTTNTNSGISYQSGGATTDQWETYANQSARFYIENTNTSNGAYLQYNSGSGWTNVSDQRWKTDWTLLEDSSSKITALNIGKYHMLDGSKETIDGAKWDYGVKAQELFEVIPDAVDVPLDSEDKYGVVPNIVFWHTVKALQEALATIDAMETRLTALEDA